MFERVAGELRATLGVDSAAMCARAGDEACGAKARSGRVSRHSTEPPISDKRRRCGGRRRGLAGLRGAAPSPQHTASATGVEGAGGSGGPGRGAGGRRRGLAGLRDDAPSRRLAARTARGRAAAHRHTQRPGPTAGPDGARNTSGATQQQHGAWTASGRAGCAAAGDLSGEQATTAGFTRPRGGQPRT